MAKKRKKLVECMDHHSIARRLGMGTQRVTSLLKGLKKIK